MSRRRSSRARLLQALYQFGLSGHWPELSELDVHFAPAHQGSAEDVEFTGQVLAALRERIQEIDDLITSASRNWRIERMAAVDLGLIRLATVELLLETAPPKVVLNEVVELAKEYGTDTSASFVNGVVDGVLRQRTKTGTSAGTTDRSR
jgi:transcription antitermination protein NusB